MFINDIKVKLDQLASTIEKSIGESNESNKSFRILKSLVESTLSLVDDFGQVVDESLNDKFALYNQNDFVSELVEVLTQVLDFNDRVNFKIINRLEAVREQASYSVCFGKVRILLAELVRRLVRCNADNFDIKLYNFEDVFLLKFTFDKIPGQSDAGVFNTNDIDFLTVLSNECGFELKHYVLREREKNVVKISCMPSIERFFTS